MRKIICLLGCIAALGCEGKKSAPAATTAATAPAGTATAAQQGAGHKDKDVKETGSQLPAVDESFHAAKELGLFESWQKTAPFKPRKLDGMKPGETAIEVGKVLVDVAVLAADTKKPVSPEAVEQAALAMKALHPPKEMLDPVVALAEDVKKGKAKDDEIRKKLAKLIVEAIPAVEEDPKLASGAGLAMAGGYLRSMAVTSKILASGAGSDAEKLDLLHRQQENAYFIDLLSTKVDASIRGEAAVKEALEALQKIKPHVDKPKTTMDDAKAIAAALARYAS